MQCIRRALTVLVPLGGFSTFDRIGGPFYDPEATQLFAETLKKGLKSGISLYLLPHHINAPEFADAIIKALDHLLSGSGQN